jgi:hypothetical protein
MELWRRSFAGDDPLAAQGFGYLERFAGGEAGKANWIGKIVFAGLKGKKSINLCF